MSFFIDPQYVREALLSGKLLLVEITERGRRVTVQPRPPGYVEPNPTGLAHS